MKKRIFLLLLISLFYMMISANVASAATTSFSFMGEPVVLNDYSDIEIINNEIFIFEDTSEIKNTILFKNISDKEVEREGNITLENNYIGLNISDLSISINGEKVDNYSHDNNGNYKFFFKIDAQKSANIKITYKTTKSLRDAKIIKYSLDKIKGKHLDRLFFSVYFNKYDIPLVEKIWPGAYEFVSKSVYTQYLDFNVNNITKDLIIKKDTYSNLKYGDNSDSSKAEEIITRCKEIMDGTRGEDYDYSWYNEHPLAARVYYKDITEYKDSIYSVPYIAGKKIAIHYYETEGDKDLYINVNVHPNYFEEREYKITKKDEYTLLRTKNAGIDYFTEATLKQGYEFVYVNSDIDGNKIDISEEEIIEYVNMINADLYVRFILYDPSNEYPEIFVGYYDEKDIYMAIALKDMTYTPGKNIEYHNDNIRLFDNELVKNNCKVPVLAKCVGRVEYKSAQELREMTAGSTLSGKTPSTYTGSEGKNIVSFGYMGGFHVPAVLNTEEAKRLTKENTARISEKQKAIMKILNETPITRYVPEETEIEESESIEKNEISTDTNINTNNTSVFTDIDAHIVLAAIASIIILLFVFFIYNVRKVIKNKRG